MAEETTVAGEQPREREHARVEFVGKLQPRAWPPPREAARAQIEQIEEVHCAVGSRNHVGGSAFDLWPRERRQRFEARVVRIHDLRLSRRAVNHVAGLNRERGVELPEKLARRAGVIRDAVGTIQKRPIVSK